MKREYYKFLKLFIIAVFLEVIVFNITSYRILFGNYNEKTFSEFEFLHPVKVAPTITAINILTNIFFISITSLYSYVIYYKII